MNPFEEENPFETAENPFEAELESIVYKENPVSAALKNTLYETGGAIMRVLEPLDRPRSAIVAALGDRPEGAVTQALKGEIHPSWGELMPEKIHIPQYEHGGILGRGTGRKEDLNVKPALALAADIIADPLNLLGVGTLTKLGKSGKILGNLAKVHGEEIGKIIGSNAAADILAAIRGKVPGVTAYLKGKGISNATIEVAGRATQALFDTLPEQAKAGQWAFARLGPVTTPRFVNEAAAKGVEAVRRKIPKTTLGKLFSTRTGDDVFDRGAREIDRIHQTRKNDIMEYGKRARDLTDADPAQFGGASPAGWYERGGMSGDLADLTKTLNRSQLDEMKARGIPIEEISEQGYSYAPHIAAEEEGVIAKLFGSLDRRRTSTYTPHRLQRDIRWIKDPNSGQEFIDSVSRFAHEQGIKADSLVTRQASVDEINTAFGKDFFKGDLAESVTIAALRNERALHGARQLEYFITKAQEDLAKVGGVAPAGWRTPNLATPKRFIVTDNGTVPIQSKLDQLRNTPMAPEKARFLEARWKEVAQPDEAVKGLKDIFTGYTSLWKRYTLFPFMEYHFRNMVGDLWNGWAQGWKGSQIPGDVYEAMLIQRGKNPLIKKAGVYGDLPGDVLKRAAEDYGVIGSGQYGEISNLLGPIESKKGLERLRSELWNLDTPVQVGQFLEDNRRLGLFKRRVQNGDTFEEAASAVKKALYDYNDLTDFEKEVRRWLIPFYTWYRKNLPAQIENMIRRPGKVNVLPKAKAHIEGSSETDIPEGLRPAWMRRGFSIHTGQDEHGNENFAILGSYLPTADLYSFGGGEDDLLTGLISNLNPLIKVPVELSGNKNYFFERPVDRLRDKDAGIFGKGGTLWGNERTDFLGANLPTSAVKLSELLPFTRLLSTLDRLNPFGIFDEGEDFDPAVLREGQIKTRPYHTEMDTLPKLMKAITGLKIYPVDVEREAMYNMESLKREGVQAPGINKANLRAMIRKATMEGDTESAKRYKDLLDVLIDKIERETALYDRYTESRR